MIFDNIRYRDCYGSNQNLRTILDYMATITPDNFPATKADLVTGEAFVNPVCFSTKPEDECLFEAHQNYADVHYIVEGCEKIIVLDIEAVIVVTPYEKEKDIGFYRGEAGTVCILRPGDFLVCYPQDAHKVAIMVDDKAPVKKLVGKLKV